MYIDPPPYSELNLDLSPKFDAQNAPVHQVW